MKNNLKFHNTKSRQKESFVPQVSGKIGMYVCGPTVYDYSHIGHARAYTFFDIVYKHLLFVGYQVTYVRNITDIDDKIIKRANDENKPFTEISEFYTRMFHEDMVALGNASPKIEPRASECIPGMIEMINKLIEKGHAYAVGGDVYFAVTSYKDYLALSGRDSEELLSGARVEINEQKRNPLDFALWKSSKPNEPFWQSPWGKGRPGWHIECSVMSQQHLGTTIDIHGGGRDLIFPHHENERAQSETCNGKTFVNYWLHNGFVNLDKEKMSKSLGNIVTIRALLQEYNSEVLRHALLSSHYRSPIDFSKDLLNDSRAAMERIYLFLSNVDAALQKQSQPLQRFIDAYTEVMNDDFNTPKAIAVLFEAVKEGNRLLQKSSDGKDKAAAAEAAAIAHTICYLGTNLGLTLQQPTSFLHAVAKTNTGALSSATIETLIQERLAARKSKDFKRSDEIRQNLLAQGILLEDHPNGTTTWRRK